MLGGDLNAEPHEVAQLQRELPFLGTMLARVPAPGKLILTLTLSALSPSNPLTLSP